MDVIKREEAKRVAYIVLTYFLDAGLDAGNPNPTPASLVAGLDAGRLNPTPPLVPGLDAGRLNPTPSLVTGLDAGRLNPKLSLVAGLDGERLDPLPSLLGERSLVAGLDAARLISPSSHPVRTLTRVNSAIRERGGSSPSAVLPPLLPPLLLPLLLPLFTGDASRMMRTSVVINMALSPGKLMRCGSRFSAFQ